MEVFIDDLIEEEALELNNIEEKRKIDEGEKIRGT